MADTLAWPVRVEDGDYVVVAVGGQAEAEQNVGVLSQTRIGERPLCPEFGIPDPVGGRGVDPQPLLDAAARWLPGVRLSARPARADRRDVTITVEVGR